MGTVQIKKEESHFSVDSPRKQRVRQFQIYFGDLFFHIYSADRKFSDSFSFSTFFCFRFILFFFFF